MPVSEVTDCVRKMRDPRGELGLEDGAPVKVQGVTPIDRMRMFNPHPSGGVWAEHKLHFDAGVNITRVERDNLMAFIDGERDTPHQQVGLDFLPPLVREDDGPSACC